jgi:6-phosphogluconolactonase (cycloisomerase 2 family)
MKSFVRLALTAAVAVAVTGAFAAPAFAEVSPALGGANHAVFVQTDNPAGNAVVAYHRADDGTLSLAGTYPTGGDGGVLAGSAVDHLASQGSLTYDAGHALLFAVNAGSNTVSVFDAHGDRLHLRQVVSSGGQFPVSIAVHHDLVYVLNARAGGSVHEYAIFGGRLFSVPGSNRALGLDPTATPEFTHTPGQVAFSPDGSQLLVTTKANGNDVDVFRIGFFGELSATPVVNVLPSAVPFAITYDPAGNLVVAEAGTNSLATFALHHNGTITGLATAATGQAATCWVVAANGQFYASNAGSGNVSRIQSGPGGASTFLDNTSTDAGTVDAAVSANSHWLYVETGANGIVDEFHITKDGSLSAVGSVTVADASGGQGIVAI